MFFKSSSSGLLVLQFCEVFIYCHKEGVILGVYL